MNLKDYICIYPFKNIEIHETNVHFCCPEWLPHSISTSDTPLNEMWNSDMAVEIRKSVMDGSYKYCDKQMCPHLNNLLKFGKDIKNVIVHKDKVEPYIKEYYDTQKGEIKETPQILQMSLDRTCNLKCPSCRLDFIVLSSEGNKKVQKRIEDITDEFGKTIHTIYTSSSGEPFASPATKNFFRTFDKFKFPKLRNIHLHTNATLWDEKMWESVKPIHPYVKSIEISIDAGNKFTYENVTRIGGDWDKLIHNLQFINSIDTIKSIKTSFIVQSVNYSELKQFLDLMKSIFGKKVVVYFGKLQDWGTYQLGEEFNSMDVSLSTHPHHQSFLEHLKSVYKDEQVFSNLIHLVNEEKTLV